MPELLREIRNDLRLIRDAEREGRAFTAIAWNLDFASSHLPVCNLRTKTTGSVVVARYRRSHWNTEGLPVWRKEPTRPGKSEVF